MRGAERLGKVLRERAIKYGFSLRAGGQKAIARSVYKVKTPQNKRDSSRVGASGPLSFCIKPVTNRKTGGDNHPARKPM